MTEPVINPTETIIRKVHKPKQYELKFEFMLDAWMHCRRNGVSKYDLKKTGAKEWTLKYIK